MVDAKRGKWWMLKQWAAEANGGQWSHMADAEAEW